MSAALVPVAPSLNPIAAAKLFSFPAHKPGPNRNLVLIQSRMTAQEALRAKQTWQPPAWLEMEPVWFRPHKGQEESPAFLIDMTAKTFTLQVFESNRPSRRIGNVSFYDPAREQHSDPYGPFNNAGTFRKSAYAAFVHDSMSQAIEVSVTEFEQRLNTLDTIVGRLPDLSEVQKLANKCNEVEARLNAMSDKLGEVVKMVSESSTATAYQRIHCLEDEVSQILKALGGTVTEEPVKT